MALRSGYKGIKKLASGLKWNRPGILAADDTALAKVFFPRSEQAVLGAKNLAPINATTVTNKGITLTVDENKIITINGTATEAVEFEISERGQWLKNGERYKLSGCKGGAVDKYKLDIAYTDTGFLAINYDQDEVEFTANNARNYVMRIVVYAGQTMNNVVIKPMVRLATDTDPTFAPPAMTNRELTEKTAELYRYGSLNTNNFRIRLVTAEIAFVNGTGTYDLSSFANDFYSFAFAAFQTYGTVWITSASVENKVLTVKARNESGPFTSDGNASIYAFVCEKL